MKAAAVKWRTDWDKDVITGNFARRNWVRWNRETDGPDGWNILWGSVNTVRDIFAADSGIRLSESQIVNHFPNHQELTRKDLMYKNLRRYRKESRKQGMDDAALSFTPLTFILPQDWPLFLEEARRRPQCTWIFKPHGRAQGRGIYLINKLSQLKKYESRVGARGNLDTYVISEYLDRPLLIGGKKFDLRIYVLVHSYRPLVAYISREGFCRFCSVKYSRDAADIRNGEMHLTNVALQRNSDAYNAAHGNKWPLSQLLLHLEQAHGPGTGQRLQNSIDFVVLHSLRAVQGSVDSNRHCFELYGYDLMVDDSLRAWLIEANASPSLTATTPEDRRMKARVVHEALQIVAPADWRSLESRFTKEMPRRVGSFELLYDEREELKAKKQQAREALERGRLSSRSERRSGVVLW
ncbi:unnamed protein product [Pedinophyceae sp. YPF-701]|nr:unnamed protein product [Pedinophyceae sp. YPF-701]